MLQNMIHYWTTIKALLFMDYVIYKKEYFKKVINVLVITTTQLVVTAHIMPYFGLQSNFGVFMIGGFIASYAFWKSYSLVAELVSDLEKEKRLTHELLLPIPSFLVFLRIIISFTLQSIASSIFIIPIAKIFVVDQFNLTDISWISLIMMLFANGFFAGAFAIFIASTIRYVSQLEEVWQRYIFPLWLLGGFEFSWVALHTIFPYGSYFELFNPILYTNEGFRSALLSDPTYIRATICIPILYVFACIFLFLGIKNLKKRLDFI